MISVCMAVHNGGKFLEAQLQSILTQLRVDDEVVIVDDGSTDNSVELINGFQDPRIRLLLNHINVGALKSFEKALREARGNFLFFSDQDDIWLPSKVERTLNEFINTGALAIVTDAVVVDNGGKTLHDSYFKWRGSGPGFLKNFYKSTFLGCCMAIRRECRDFLLPFPALSFMHDQWTGLACSFVGRVVFLPEPLLLYRRHASTLTKMQRSSWRWIAGQRLKLLASFGLAAPRLLRWRLTRSTL